MFRSPVHGVRQLVATVTVAANHRKSHKYKRKKGMASMDAMPFAYVHCLRFLLQMPSDDLQYARVVVDKGDVP